LLKNHGEKSYEKNFGGHSVKEIFKFGRNNFKIHTLMAFTVNSTSNNKYQFFWGENVVYALSFHNHEKKSKQLF
jgi:hypothetical protein